MNYQKIKITISACVIVRGFNLDELINELRLLKDVHVTENKNKGLLFISITSLMKPELINNKAIEVNNITKKYLSQQYTELALGKIIINMPTVVVKKWVFSKPKTAVFQLVNHPDMRIRFSKGAFEIEVWRKATLSRLLNVSVVKDTFDSNKLSNILDCILVAW